MSCYSAVCFKLFSNLVVISNLHEEARWKWVEVYVPLSSFHNFTVPAPISVMLSSSIPNPIPPFGFNVTLTCAVELSPAVDVPVTVNTALSTPQGFTTTSNAQPVMGSSTNYATISTISSFMRSDSGLYLCEATVSLPSNAYISDSRTVSHSVRVTTGKMFTVMLS